MGKAIGLASIVGRALPHINAFANSLLESQKLSTSIIASFKDSSVVIYPSHFCLLATTQANRLRAIDGPVDVAEFDEISTSGIGLSLRPKIITLYIQGDLYSLVDFALLVSTYSSNSS